MMERKVTLKEIKEAIDYFLADGIVKEGAVILWIEILDEFSPLVSELEVPPGTIVLKVGWIEDEDYVIKFLKIEPAKLSEYLS